MPQREMGGEATTPGVTPALRAQKLAPSPEQAHHAASCTARGLGAIAGNISSYALASDIRAY